MANTLLAFVRRPRPVTSHAYDYRCECMPCRLIHADRIETMRAAIYACRQALPKDIR